MRRLSILVLAVLGLAVSVTAFTACGDDNDTSTGRSGGPVQTPS